MNNGLISGRYQLEHRLGSGGMSTVHLALDTRLERPVAIKLLAEHLAHDPTFVSRFRREALAAGRLVHPNVVQVFDSGLDEGTGRHFIVMEYIHGPSCAQLLRDHGYLGVDETLAIVVQACHGLAYAHRHGVVHRDVKPGNLLRSEEGVVKLADFGIAKAAEQSSITQVGSVLGTAAYLAPEQARGEEAGPAADLYSLGVVTYQLLSGRLPYEAGSLSELALRQQQEIPARLDTLSPEIPAALAEAVARALSLEPLGRYESAHDMAEALEAGARGVAPALAPHTAESTAATRVLATPTEATRALRPPEPARAPRRPRAPAEAAPGAPPAAPPRRRRRRGARLLALLLIALILAGGAAAVVASSSGGGGVKLGRNVMVRDVQQAVTALKSLIDDNTR
jgi:serine/threonine-protein kinase